MTTPAAASKSINGVTCLYEAQISFTLTGIDHGVWTAYCAIDTYFESKGTVDDYRRWKGQCGFRADPIAADRLLTDNPIWPPREYFFKILEIRMEQVLKEWNWTVDRMEEEVKQYV